MTSGYVDIHCHILPDVDDGAPSLADALEMATMASADGIQTIIATPHANHEYPPRPAEELLQRVASLQAEIDRIGVPLRILPGADVQISESLAGHVQNRRILTLADTGRYILLEMPHDIYVPLDGLMSELKKAGVRSILSHPERNCGIRANLGLLEHLVERGCLLQVTAGSILGEFGREAKAAALHMLEHRLIHFVATDAHSPRYRKPLLREAYRCVAALSDEPYADQIFKQFPAAVAQGKSINVSRPHTPTRSFFARLFG
jgi:protein-tyrosine phosphatase